jgi:uncharacterized protein (DUF433 family)
MASIVGTVPKPVRLDEGGDLKVGDTRVSLDSVVYAFNRGDDAAEIQRSFDTLSLAEVYAAISYYLHNKAKVDAYLRQNEIDYEKKRVQNRKDFPNAPTREMLLARKNGTDPDWNR